MKINSFEDLECWKEAVSLATDIYRTSAMGEFSKDFSFRDQIRKSAVSIAANISECKERETLNEFIRFLFIAKGSAGELRTHLFIAKNIGYLKEDIFNEFYQRVARLSGMTGNLIKALKKRK